MIDIRDFERHTSFKPNRRISIEEKKEWERIFSSLRSGAILTGTVMGNDTVLMPDGEEKLALTIIQYRIKVIIPYDEVWYNSEKCPPPHVIRSMTGAHVDYVITGIRMDGECCIASRKRALTIRRRSFLKLPFKSGKRVTCNVIAVGRAKALCTCGGFDVLLSTQDISYGMIPDLKECMHTGEEHEVILKSYDEKTHQLKISIKEAKPHPFDGAEQRHPVNCRRASVITGKYDGGVFCRLENELDCLCSYLPEQNALDFHIGDRVVIVIRKYNYERKLVFGRILARR